LFVSPPVTFSFKILNLHPVAEPIVVGFVLSKFNKVYSLLVPTILMALILKSPLFCVSVHPPIVTISPIEFPVPDEVVYLPLVSTAVIVISAGQK
jgi:hypothetical protein